MLFYYQSFVRVRFCTSCTNEFVRRLVFVHKVQCTYMALHVRTRDIMYEDYLYIDHSCTYMSSPRSVHMYRNQVSSNYLESQQNSFSLENVGDMSVFGFERIIEGLGSSFFNSVAPI